ncbi:hypothetical protein T296_17450 [Pantoea agglomerans Eh318]|nr:hypothetical protein T296_17450 [Pantoea agglomerans Eh318]
MAIILLFLMADQSRCQNAKLYYAKHFLSLISAFIIPIFFIFFIFFD